MVQTTLVNWGEIATANHCCWHGHREHVKGATFMPFPKPHIDREQSERWIRAYRREGLVSTTLRNTQTFAAFARCI